MTSKYSLRASAIDALAEAVDSIVRRMTLSTPPADMNLHGCGFRVWTDVDDVTEELDRRLGLYYQAGMGGDAIPFTVIAIDEDLGLIANLSNEQRVDVEIQHHHHQQQWTRTGQARQIAGFRVVQHQETGSVSITDGPRRRIIIANRSRGLLAKDARRLVRDLLAARLLSDGAVEFHASGVCVGDDGIAVGAPSGSGKTTLLIEMLRTRRAALLCNGRLFLRPSQEGLEVLGVPEHVLLRPGTIAYNPELKDFAPDWLAAEVASGLDVWDTGRDKKIAVQLRDFVTAFAVPTARIAKLRAVVLAQVQNADTGASVSSGLDLRDEVDSLLLDRAATMRRFWHGAVEIDWPTFEESRVRTLGVLVASTKIVKVRRGRDWPSVGNQLIEMAGQDG